MSLCSCVLRGQMKYCVLSLEMLFISFKEETLVA